MRTYFTKHFLKGLLIVFFITFSSFAKAQLSYFYYVQFTDKKNSPYSLSQPEAYLSQRAIERRETFKIPIDSVDLPVNPAYLDAIHNLGITIHNHSKWMNGVTITMTDTSSLAVLKTLPFVQFVENTGNNPGSLMEIKQKAKGQKKKIDYGVAEGQINQLNGKYLHDLNYRGKGIHIAVLDGGFKNVDANPVFDSLRLQGRLLGTKDFVNPSTNFYSTDAHGGMVLSVLAGNLPGAHVGTAPEASYWLIRTEYVTTEYKMETDFWCSGIEFADSVGVDVVNSSLGYYTFYDKKTSFKYSDMNGKVSRASRAAEIASKKGIIVVVSAGNEGNNEWQYIGSPADADGIITVGSVNIRGESSPFSSYGPSFDQRIKPELCALGSSTALINANGGYTSGDGTSFASPVMAGMMASFLQFYKQYEPNPNLETLFESVFKSASYYNNPTDLMGYGIPNFVVAQQYLSIKINKNTPDPKDIFSLSYIFDYKSLLIKFFEKDSLIDARLRIIDVTGRVLYNKPVDNDVQINTENFATGVYVINVINAGRSRTKKILFR